MDSQDPQNQEEGSPAAEEQTVDNNSLQMDADEPLDVSPEEAETPSANDEDISSISSAERVGTTASARFNILSTMVGGGSLSLPLAFQKCGNALAGPLLLLLVGGISDFCFRTLVASARTLSPPDPRRAGKDSFESIANAAFGAKAYLVSTILVTAMCFFGTVGYAVLLRDMLQPISDAVFKQNTSGPTWANNATMFTVVLVVTPLCTLKTLTALKRFGAASMFSVLILGCCIVYRSIQCNLGILDHGDGPAPVWWKSFQFFPDRWKDILDVFPIFISCFVCHYNIPTVHNELRNPSARRVRWWLKSTTWSAGTFYMIMGIAGSAYAPCTATGTVHGNVLLDFHDDDPLLLVGRMCLALTITLAFPMLTIPARDILLRSLPDAFAGDDATSVFEPVPSEALREPLLNEGAGNNDEEDPEVAGEVVEEEECVPSASLLARLAASVVVFWTAALVASCVSSIDVVWDLLGSSLSILLSVLIPCGSYLVISRNRHGLNEANEYHWKEKLSVVGSWLLLLIFVPLMFVSTGNAVVDTFL